MLIVIGMVDYGMRQREALISELSGGEAGVYAKSLGTVQSVEVRSVVGGYRCIRMLGGLWRA